MSQRTGNKDKYLIMNIYTSWPGKCYLAINRKCFNNLPENTKLCNKNLVCKIEFQMLYAFFALMEHLATTF